MKQALTRRLFAYWDEIRGDRLAPERADIDPVCIRDLLGYAFLLEIDSAGAFPFRLSGNYISALFLRELRGSSFIELWRSGERAEIAELLVSALDEAVPTLLGASTGPAGRLAIDLELLFLPIRHHGKTHARIFGSLAPAVHPSWFGLLAAEPLNLHSIRILHPEEIGGQFSSSLARTENSPFAIESTAQQAITRCEHLTVFSSRN